ncbi:MAG: hypothetical protein BRD37_02820 [Bacteroidetes bacterium QH_8_67_23]|nr:MAG: hypothetical protein BRD37_02820 [Bacteroidetes bacterium QH_8_67_23]
MGPLAFERSAKTLTFSLTIAAPSKKERDGAFPAKVSRRLFRQKPYVSDRAKVTPVLWKHKTNSDGHSPIYLRIYASGQTKYKSLSVSIHPRHWNERQRRVRKSCRHHGQINAPISGKLADAWSFWSGLRGRAGARFPSRQHPRALRPPTIIVIRGNATYRAVLGGRNLSRRPLFHTQST